MHTKFQIIRIFIMLKKHKSLSLITKFIDPMLFSTLLPFLIYHQFTNSQTIKWISRCQEHVFKAEKTNGSKGIGIWYGLVRLGPLRSTDRSHLLWFTWIFSITWKNEHKVSTIKTALKRVNQEKMHTFALINVQYEYRTTKNQ